MRYHYLPINFIRFLFFQAYQICDIAEYIDKSVFLFHIKINAFNNARGVESTAVAFITDRPAFEPGFYLVRQEGKGRQILYTIQSYAVQSAGEGSRY